MVKTNKNATDQLVTGDEENYFYLVLHSDCAVVNYVGQWLYCLLTCPSTSYYRGLHHQPCWVSKWVAWPLNNLTLSLWYAIYKHLWHTSLHWLKDLSLRKKSTLVVQSLTIWLGNQRIGCPVGQVISNMLIN